MATSTLIARLLGPILVVAAITMLATPRALQEMAREFLKSRALIYLTGILALLGGLAIIDNHNRWVMDWPVIITAFGWAMVLGGIVRMTLPSTVISMGAVMLGNQLLIRIFGVIWVLIGAFLTYKGYVQGISVR